MKSYLFIVKSGESYGGGYRPPGGLLNSARFVVDMLNAAGVPAALEQAIDNNDIDRLVTEHRPDVVIVEALWVVPEKFDVLKKLHPNVAWIVRLHSELAFLATEGIAFEWISGYQARGVRVASNSARLVADFPAFKYLPNFYPTPAKLPAHEMTGGTDLLVSCFGAMRPLKNHLAQAVAAIQYAKRANKKLQFWVNTTSADPQVLRNVRALFAASASATLHEVGWYSHLDFLAQLAAMDVAMQCSLSETFNICTADAVSLGVPVVVSPEISWACRLSQVDSTNVQAMVKGLGRAVAWPKLLPTLNLRGLRAFSASAKKAWLSA